jgi:xanthine/uracil permease
LILAPIDRQSIYFFLFENKGVAVKSNYLGLISLQPRICMDIEVEEIRLVVKLLKGLGLAAIVAVAMFLFLRKQHRDQQNRVTRRSRFEKRRKF